MTNDHEFYDVDELRDRIAILQALLVVANDRAFYVDLAFNSANEFEFRESMLNSLQLTESQVDVVMSFTLRQMNAERRGSLQEELAELRRLI